MIYKLFKCFPSVFSRHETWKNLLYCWNAPSHYWVVLLDLSMLAKMVMFQIRTHFLRNVSKRQYRGRFRNATLTHVWCCNDLNSLIWQSRGQHFWFPNCWLFPLRLYFLGYGFYTVDQLLLLHVQLNITEDINKRCPKKMSLFNRAWKSFIFRRVVIP